MYLGQAACISCPFPDCSDVCRAVVHVLHRETYVLSAFTGPACNRDGISADGLPWAVWSSTIMRQDCRLPLTDSLSLFVHEAVLGTTAQLHWLKLALDV